MIRNFAYRISWYNGGWKCRMKQACTTSNTLISYREWARCKSCATQMWVLSVSSEGMQLNPRNYPECLEANKESKKENRIGIGVKNGRIFQSSKWIQNNQSLKPQINVLKDGLFASASDNQPKPVFWQYYKTITSKKIFKITQINWISIWNVIIMVYIFLPTDYSIPTLNSDKNEMWLAFHWGPNITIFKVSFC